ncbi:MAG: 4Fe-4S binding protein [Thermoprotei archaeon]
MGYLEPTLWAIAAAMVYITARILKYAGRAKNELEYVLSVFLIVMMASMFGGAVIYFLYAGPNGLIAAVAASSAVMVIGFIPVLSTLVKLSSSVNPPLQQQWFLSRRLGNRLLVVCLAILSELLMGWAFALASHTLSPSLGVGAQLGRAVSSYWFVFPMAGEMALSSYYFRREFERSVYTVFAFQAPIMLLTPTAIANQQWEQLSVYVGGSLMTAMFIYVFDYLYKHRKLNAAFGDYVFRVIVAYTFMMSGLFLWMAYHQLVLFDASIIMEMLIYFDTVLSPLRYAGSAQRQWLLEPNWTFRMLVAIFAAEFFMGGVFDLEYYGVQPFLSTLQLAPLTGNPLSVLGAAAYNFIQWFSLITGSAWYLIMMGAEMGSLVVFRLREIHVRETKIRLTLMLLAYAAYAVLLPYFVIPGNQLPNIPFVGQAMGIGTASPVAPAFAFGLVTTYIVYGVLSFLFGSRALCSVFCTAATMYQGTFYDVMKTFNRTTKTGRKLLGSRITKTYRVASTLVWASIIVAATISYLNATGRISLTVFGEDAAQFLYSFYFNFLWYIVFLMIPFIGTYGCVTTGMCHWGMTNQWISRLGFFRLKVKDRNTCIRCPTKDCSKACPVGLTDMPGQFIAKGEFRSSKCIGVGDCVESCPYGNIYFYDVRNWIRERLGIKPRQPQT